MKVLVIGSGGREHAITLACQKSPLVTSVIAAPGNGGIPNSIPVNIESVSDMVKLAEQENVDFVIVGPEVPLSLGLVDALVAKGILAFGPNKQAAQFEASKEFTKNFLVKYNIPTARSASFKQLTPALNYLKAQTFPTVIKASGLAAGKGVVIAQDYLEGKAALTDMHEGNIFGESGHTVLIEDYLEGEEASIMLVVSGKDYILLPTSQDHKRLGEGDTGLNTGGMGAYAPADIVTESVLNMITETIVKPTIAGFQAEYIDYRGVLYIGIMLTKSGPKVLEFNVRFGDPECQVLLPLIKSDPIELLYNCAQGTLNKNPVSFNPGYAITVVLTAPGYPGKYEKGLALTLPDNIPSGTSIIHAGTYQNKNGSLKSSGGRVLCITATAATLQAAAEKAYGLISQIPNNPLKYRYDIGFKQLARVNLISK